MMFDARLVQHRHSVTVTWKVQCLEVVYFEVLFITGKAQITDYLNYLCL